MEKRGSPPTAAESHSDICDVLKLGMTNSWPVQNPGKQPSSAAITFIIPSQCRREQSKGELLVCFGLSPGTERLRRPFVSNCSAPQCL